MMMLATKHANFIIVLMVIFLTFSPLYVTAKIPTDKIDSLLGTWIGERINPRLATEQLTLIITKSPEGKLIGTLISILNGTKKEQNVDIRVTLEKGFIVLEFTKEVTPMRNAEYHLTLKSKNYLEGTSSGFSTSTVRLTKQ